MLNIFIITVFMLMAIASKWLQPEYAATRVLPDYHENDDMNEPAR